MNKNRKLSIFSIIAITSTLLMTLTLSLSKTKNTLFTKGATNDYSITLNSSNAPSMSASYDREGTSTVVTKGDYSLNLKYRLAMNESGKHIKLAPHGFIYNEVDNSNHKNKVTSLLSIQATYSSDSNLTIRTSLRNDGKEFGAPVALPNGSNVTFNDAPYYFIIEAGDSAASITSITFNYSCSQNSLNINSLSGSYTGEGSDGYIYKLTLNGTSANLASLNKQSNVSYNGTASITNSSQLSCSLTISENSGTYVTNVSEDHRVLTYASKSGAASSLPTITFYKVYKVEDFESYSQTGNAFGGSGRGADSLYSMSGLRSQWHCDWYTSNNYAVSYLDDSGWKVMGSTDFLSYSSNKGNNSSKAAVFKGNGNGLRYMQMKAVLGLPNIIGKGSYMTFMARSYSNSGLSTVSSSATNFKIYGFYNQTTTKSNVGDKTSVDLTIPASSAMARYTISLDETKDYYAFGFYSNNSTTAYVVIDDVEIYTINPYASYVAPVAVTGVSVSPNVLNLETGSSSTLTATVSPSNATNKNVSWASNNTSVATVTNGTVSAVGTGNATITVTTADGGYTATCAVTVTSPVVYPSGSYKGSATVLGNNYEIVLAFGTRSNGYIGVRLSNSDAEATGITYNTSTNGFTITTTGSYSGYKYGNITGTYNPNSDTITGISCSGNIKSYVSNNGNITASRITNLWDCDGTTSELQSMFKRRYMSGSWQVDTSNADRITSNTTEFVSGTGSLKRRGYTGGAVALNFNNDFSPAKSVSNVQFWVYNPSNSDITLRMWTYTGANFGSGDEIGPVTAKKNQWTYLAMGFSTRSIYNFQIADFNNTGTYLSFDNIVLF